MAEIIVALDHPDAQSAVALLDLLPDAAPVKVGAVLATAAGAGFVRGVVTSGHPVFLDCKWHDIPNTVAGAIRSARDLGVEMVTVHALGGPAMLEAAVAAADGALAVVAVTVLTSHDADAVSQILGRAADPATEVERLARIAMAAGVSGVVCSPLEVALVRPIVGSGRIVVPGVRRTGDAVGDQARVATPRDAVRAGATHLVVGRPILDASDPAGAYQEFLGETSES